MWHEKTGITPGYHQILNDMLTQTKVSTEYPITNLQLSGDSSRVITISKISQMSFRLRIYNFSECKKNASYEHEYEDYFNAEPDGWIMIQRVE